MAKNDRYVAIYARQSVDKKDSVSIETQIADCKHMCSENENIRTYQDKGYSGKNTERPDLQKLILDIKQGIIKKVVVYKLDRISRNISDFYKLYEVMKEHDCEFVSKNEAFDTTNAMGRAMMGILAVFAQMERENTQLRIKDNYQYRIKQGTWASGKAPFGFKNDKVDGEKTLTPVPEEMEVVKWMFKVYAEEPSISLGKIQSRLIEKGFKGHQSKNGGFSRTTINHILTNPIYCKADGLLYQYYQKKFIEFVNGPEQWNGKFAACVIGKNGRSLRNDDLEGIKVYITNVQGMIDSRTFIMVQNRLEQNQQIASDNSPNHNLQELSGLLKCAKCGSAIKMQARPTLTCTGRGQKKICDVSFAGLRLETIQDNVSEKVQKYLDSGQEIAKQKKIKREKSLAEIQDLEKQRENLLDIASVSDSVANVVKQRINDLTVAIDNKRINLQLDTAEDVIWLRLGADSHSPVQSIFGADGKAVFSYKDLDTKRKQAVLRVLVNKILVYPDGSVVLEWNE